MSKTSVYVFRAESLRRYAESQQRSVFPRCISTRIFVRLWLLLGLLLASGLVAWFVKGSEIIGR
jgi:hypothetical protein